jgi:hypothetical protein
VEGYSNHIKIELARERKKRVRVLHGGAKFDGQLARSPRVIGHDTKQKLGIRMVLLDLVKLVSVVERHEFDAPSASIAKVRRGLARISIHNPVGTNPEIENSLNLVLGRTVKVGPRGGEKLDDTQVAIALDGIVWCNIWQLHLPTAVRAVHVTEIRDKERVFVARKTLIGVNSVNAVAESLLHNRSRPNINVLSGGRRV